MKQLETDRLLLRSFTKEDADDMFEYSKNPNVGPNAGWPEHQSKEDSLKIIDMFLKNDDVWAIVLKDNNKVIGSLGLHKDQKRNNENSKMIGYVLSQDYWGNGYVPEAVKRVLKYAFEELTLQIVSVAHYPFNTRSKRVIEKCGFKYEGTLRLASTIYNGNTYDDVCYAITKEEYQNINNPT